MAGSPAFKVYDANKVYQGAVKEPRAAASLAMFYGDGATVRYLHGKTLWTYYPDNMEFESYDSIAQRITDAVKALQRTAFASQYGKV